MMKGRHESFPWFTGTVLFGTFGLILVMLLVNSGAATPVQTVTPAATAPVVAAVPTQVIETEAAAPAAAAAPEFDMQMVAAGENVYRTVCFACHGPDLKGIPGLGKNLLDSAFVHGLSDEELQAFIITGRAATDRDNTTGIAMPPRGGNTATTDEQIADVVTFIRYQTALTNGTLSAAPAAPTQPSAPVEAAATQESSGGLPIDSVLQPSGDSAATEEDYQLPIYSFLTPSGEEAAATEAPTEAEPAAEVAATEAPATAAPATTEAPFSLPIDSVLTPSGG